MKPDNVGVIGVLADSREQFHSNLGRQGHEPVSEVLNLRGRKRALQHLAGLQLLDQCEVVIDAELCGLLNLPTGDDVLDSDESLVLFAEVTEGDRCFEAAERAGESVNCTKLVLGLREKAV